MGKDIMTGRELIEEIMKHDNIDLPISISVDYNIMYPYRRVFTNEFFGINDTSSADEIKILFGGYCNNDMETDD
jgi:hypothetical protein